MDEVLVIGGGPAGSAAAGLLAQLGHRVTLLTRSRRYRLAESLPPSAGRVLAELGLLETVERGGFYRSRGNTVWWGAEMRVESFPADTCGWQVERPRLDELLLNQAVAAGVAVQEQAAVRSITLEGDHASVTHQAGQELEVRRARWLLDCSGRGGMLARRGHRIPAESQATLALAAVWRSRDWEFPDETHTVVESYRDGWVWSVPTSRQDRFVAAMVDARRGRGDDNPSLAGRYLSELTKARQLHRRLAQATMLRSPRGLSAAPYGCDRAAGAGWLLVGDAASFVDPLSSFGLKKAFASAWLAAVVVHSCLTEPDITAAAVELYAAREQEMYVQLSRNAARLFAHAGAAHPDPFWAARSAVPAGPEDDHPERLWNDPQVQAAFQALKQAGDLALQPARDVQRASRPLVRGRRVVLEEHVQCGWQPGGIRYLRNVCIPRLVDLAPSVRQIPDLYQRYLQAEGAIPLSDFLGVLAVLLARRVLIPDPGAAERGFNLGI